jgi:hypothetical protein
MIIPIDLKTDIAHTTLCNQEDRTQQAHLYQNNFHSDQLRLTLRVSIRIS